MSDGGRILPRALRAAAPLLAGHGVVLASGFLLQVALVGWAFRDRPDEMARVGLLSQALQWVAVVALAGLPAGVLRIVPARPAEAADVLATARVAVFGTTIALSAILVLAPSLRRELLGESEASDAFAIYVWRAVSLSQIVLAAAWLHAQGRLAAKATAESVERVLVLGGALAGALWLGLSGYALGNTAASTVGAALAIWITTGRGVRGRFRFDLLRDLGRVGAPQLLIAVLETLRPLLVLRLAMQTVGDQESGFLATGMAFSLPLVALPELAAQALFPAMLGPKGEGGHVRGETRRVVREVLVAGTILLVAYGAVAAWLLPLAGSGKYAGAVAALLLLLPGVLAHGLTSHAGYVLLVRDRLRWSALASAVSVVVGGALGWALLPRYGAAGGAAALSAAALVRTVIVLVAAR